MNVRSSGGVNRKSFRIVPKSENGAAWGDSSCGAALLQAGIDCGVHEAPRMSSFWPPSLRTCGGSHRWSLGRHPLGPCVLRSVGVA